jgi:hypothetical protein
VGQLTREALLLYRVALFRIYKGNKRISDQRVSVGSLLQMLHTDVKIDDFFYLFIYCIFIVYSRYLKRVISKRDGCEYLKQVPSSDGSLELI